jgi:hypothetical protein
MTTFSNHLILPWSSTPAHGIGPIMSTQTFNLFQRRAIWEAHAKRCAYCGDPIAFRDVEIDHIVPESFAEKLTDWERTRSELGLPANFDLRSLGNLVPACRSCNQRKSDRLLLPGRAVIEISRAMEKAPRVQELIKAFRTEDMAEKARFRLVRALELGEIGEHDLAEMLALFKQRQGRFRLSNSNIFDDKPILEVSRGDVDRLLDAPVKFAFGEPGRLRLVTESDDEIYVQTLREYRRAVAQGYFPLSNAEMAAASIYFERPLAVLEAVLAARVADRSYIDNPRCGVTDLALMPATLLFTAADITDDPAFADYKERLNGKSIQDVVNAGEQGRRMAFSYNFPFL